MSSGDLPTRNMSTDNSAHCPYLYLKKYADSRLSEKYIFDRANDARPLGREGRSVLAPLANLCSSFPSVLLSLRGTSLE